MRSPQSSKSTAHNRPARAAITIVPSGDGMPSVSSSTRSPGDSPRSTGAAHQLAPAIRTRRTHASRALLTKGALKAADKSRSIGRQPRATFLTAIAHLEAHPAPFHSFQPAGRPGALLRQALDLRLAGVVGRGAGRGGSVGRQDVCTPARVTPVLVGRKPCPLLDAEHPGRDAVGDAGGQDRRPPVVEYPHAISVDDAA